MNRLGWIAVVILLVATGLSIRAALASRTQATSDANNVKTEYDAQLDRLKSEMNKLRQAQDATTSYVDKFPDNMQAITDLISRTRDRLVVITDYCAYGHYSAPEDYRKYKAALAEIIQKKRTVEAHVYDPTTASKMTLSQFGLDKQKTEADSFADEKASLRFKHYFEYHESIKDPKPMPHDSKEFDALMQSEQATCLQDLRNQGVRIRNDIVTPLPLFMWIRDHDEAIFSVYNLGSNVREVSLTTKDPTLFNLLNDLAESVRNAPRTQ